MREIGGYIEFERNHGNEYHQGAIALNSGRHCLAYLIETKNIRKIHLPYYLCSSVREICDQYSVHINYYHIDENLTPEFNSSIGYDEYFYFVNYYGQFSNQFIKDLSNRISNLIVDNAQAFFQKPVEGIDTLYSCRKFFGVPDGAYLYTDKKLDRDLDRDISFKRMSYLLARYETNASDYYPEYISNNQLFTHEPIKLMSKLTENLLRGIDYRRVMSKREENFIFLHKKLAATNRLIIQAPLGPYMYPFLTIDGLEKRKRMQKDKIYIPILWPNVLNVQTTRSLENEYAMNILPLPCDHRYSINDLEKMLKYC